MEILSKLLMQMQVELKMRMPDFVLDIVYARRANKFIKQGNFYAAFRVGNQIIRSVPHDRVFSILTYIYIAGWDFDNARKGAKEVHNPFKKALLYLAIGVRTKDLLDFTACSNARLEIPKSKIWESQFVYNELSRALEIPGR